MNQRTKPNNSITQSIKSNQSINQSITNQSQNKTQQNKQNKQTHKQNNISSKYHRFFSNLFLFCLLRFVHYFCGSRHCSSDIFSQKTFRKTSFFRQHSFRARNVRINAQNNLNDPTHLFVLKNDM
jgi:hypothetical protein